MRNWGFSRQQIDLWEWLDFFLFSFHSGFGLKILKKTITIDLYIRFSTSSKCFKLPSESNESRQSRVPKVNGSSETMMAVYFLGRHEIYLDMMIFSFGRIFEFVLSQRRVGLIGPLKWAAKTKRVVGHYRPLVPHYSTKQFLFGVDQSSFYIDCYWYSWRNKFAPHTDYSR